MPLSADTDWRAINDAALDALGTVVDFRLLAQWRPPIENSRACSRSSTSLGVASRWLENYFDDVVPGASTTMRCAVRSH